MATKMKLLCWWSGLVFFLVWGSGLFIAGWLPPLDPSANAGTVAEILRTDSTHILLGVAVMTLMAPFYLPWTVLISELIKEVEESTTVLSQVQMISGVMAQVTFFIPPFFWGVAAYRPERAPEISQGFVDAGWLIFITGITPFILQYLALSIAIFKDKRAMPIFPRWVAYLQIWISVSFIPAIVPFFVKSGPFSWNGIFVWWLPLTLFIVWFVSMLALSKRYISQ